MSRLTANRDLRPLDVLVLKDIVRFGVLATDQIERRFGDPALAAVRLPVLLNGNYLEPWPDVLQGTAVYSPSARGARVANCGLRHTRPSAHTVPHNVAVVDLADYLLEHEPGSVWRTEREVARVLLEALTSSQRRSSWRRERGHEPDGLLVVDGKRIGIELERSGKSIAEYERICRWFARTTLLVGVRWYVVDPKVGDKIREVNRQHGFDLDVEVRIELLPPGVVVRQRVGPLAHKWPEP
jgi:hypothetical protein